MKLTLQNLCAVKKLCQNNPNEVITIDDIDYCWVISDDIPQFKNGCFRVDFACGWETLYI